MTADLATAYDAALEWADRQDLWIAEHLPNEVIGVPIRSNIERHFGGLARAAEAPPVADLASAAESVESDRG
jgi:hypothetical protein